MELASLLTNYPLKMFNQKAFDILNSSINSVVFIDEKAKDFFTGPVNYDILEEKLSVNLFNTFKENGKSLAVHKFEVSNLTNPNTLDYLFKGRDLILLDWELAGVAGQEHSLKLLSRAVSTPHINFCCIYSSSTNFNEIPLFLDTYFSGISKDEFDTIKNSYNHIEPFEIQKIWNEGEEKIDVFFQENDIDLENLPLEKLKNKSRYIILRYIYISLTSDKYIIPENPEREFEVLTAGNDSFIINNTFVLALKKDVDSDSDYNNLLKRISDAIVKNNGSFFQLLGLEMQSVFNSNERFIDETILKSSTEALFQFRNHLKDDKTFATIIKKLLIEQATLKLRTAKLELLKPDFLDFKSQDLENKTPTHDDLFQLNVFYNSVTVKGLHPESIPNLNFGDVFIDEKGTYYLCVTALCDCYDPNKIQGNFYFVIGKEFKNIDLALKLGDTAFINFLPTNTAVYWGNLESAKFAEIEKQKENESIDAYRVRKLTNEIEGYRQFLYKPFYVKPQVFNVENNKLIDDKLRVWDISNKYSEQELNQNLNCFNLTYITTLRNDYTQRIANHAFGHPARVGVDFVKIK
ncbi:response regulator receiver domain [Fluviicola taffensis]|uniref:response regulator receiver domain n=1 Tax=Fluviicola taffensis TaxID=191579 RepID=UPI003138174B